LLNLLADPPIAMLLPVKGREGRGRASFGVLPGEFRRTAMRSGQGIA
jgi:hypothetical protein